MTIVNVNVAGVKLDSVIRKKLVARLIVEFASVEVGQYSEQIAAGFAVKIDEIDADSLWIGLKPAIETNKSSKAVIINALVMAGPWNAMMKEELIAKLDAAARDILDMPKRDATSNVWITITEIEEGSFGVGGKSLSIAQLIPFFTYSRQQRIIKYLEPIIPIKTIDEFQKKGSIT